MPEVISLVILDEEIYAISMVKFVKDGCTIEDSCASGFFYEDDNKYYFVTNRHVVYDDNPKEVHFPEEIRLFLHTDEKDLTKNNMFTIPLYDQEVPKWLEHPDYGKEIDVVALPINKDEITSKYYIKPFNKSHLNPYRYLSLGEDLLVVGFPEGERDTRHNAPIVRAATIATLYNVCV